MARERTTEVFNQTAATYDIERARLIPGYDAFYKTALDLIPVTATHVLELGTGTGLFAAMLRDRLPRASLHLIDSSEAMLSKARQRFAEDPQIVFQLGDYTVAPWRGPYDAVVSALSIHHLDDAAKQSLFL
ncbi:MAG TPA: class I SAM-dependent methyltransferase, partial [Acidobacteriaceae bacterium]|nr:class I SAM-dependent methyltransferase [Acidobacteriaceae bacterium]